MFDLAFSFGWLALMALALALSYLVFRHRIRHP